MGRGTEQNQGAISKAVRPVVSRFRSRKYVLNQETPSLNLADIFGSERHRKIEERYILAQCGSVQSLIFNPDKGSKTDMNGRVWVETNRPKDGSFEDKIIFIKGVVRHELCHLLRTNKGAFKRFMNQLEELGRKQGMKEALQIKHLWNILEDGMIERWAKNSRPGMYRFIYLRNMLDPKVGNDWTEKKTKVVPWDRDYIPVDADGNELEVRDGNLIIPAGTKLSSWTDRPAYDLDVQAQLAIMALALPMYEVGQLHPKVQEALDEMRPYILAAVTGNTQDCAERAYDLQAILRKYGLLPPEIKVIDGGTAIGKPTDEDEDDDSLIRPPVVMVQAPENMDWVDQDDQDDDGSSAQPQNPMPSAAGSMMPPEDEENGEGEEDDSSDAAGQDQGSESGAPDNGGSSNENEPGEDGESGADSEGDDADSSDGSSEGASSAATSGDAQGDESGESSSSGAAGEDGEEGDSASGSGESGSEQGEERDSQEGADSSASGNAGGEDEAGIQSSSASSSDSSGEQEDEDDGPNGSNADDDLTDPSGSGDSGDGPSSPRSSKSPASAGKNDQKDADAGKAESGSSDGNEAGKTGDDANGETGDDEDSKDVNAVGADDGDDTDDGKTGAGADEGDDDTAKPEARADADGKRDADNKNGAKSTRNNERANYSRESDGEGSSDASGGFDPDAKIPSKDEYRQQLESARQEVSSELKSTVANQDEAHRRQSGSQYYNWSVPPDHAQVRMRDMAPYCDDDALEDEGGNLAKVGMDLAVQYKLMKDKVKRPTTHVRRGRLDKRALGRAVAGDPNVMMRAGVKSEEDMQVEVVIDRSGSTNPWISHLYRMAMMFGHAGNRTKIPTAIWGYDGGNTLDPDDRYNRDHYHVGHFEYKAADKPDLKALRAIFKTGGGGTPTGDAIEFARARFAHSKAKQKLLPIITDGDPDNVDFCADQVANARREGITVICLAFNCQRQSTREKLTKAFGADGWMEIEDYAKAPAIVAGIIRKMKQGHLGV